MVNHETKWALKLELVSVVLITIGRPLLNAVGVAVWHVRTPTLPFGYFHFTECVRGMYLVGIIIFLVWLKRESWTQLGILRPRWGADLGIGILIMLLSYLLRIPFAFLFTVLGFNHGAESFNPFQNPSSNSEYVWIIVSAVIVGFAEELLTRGYLISRLGQLFDRWNCILISSLVFAVWHMAKGLEDFASALILGLIFGWTFTKTHRLWPVVVAHSINNVLADFVSLGK